MPQAVNVKIDGIMKDHHDIIIRMYAGFAIHRDEIRHLLAAAYERGQQDAQSRSD